MIKYIGGALLIAAGWILGNTFFTIYRDRVEMLDRFQAFLSYSENEISFFKTEMKAIIEKFRKNADKYDDLIFDKEKRSFIKNKELSSTINTFFERVTLLDSENHKYFYTETKNNVAILKEKAVKDIEIKGKMAKRLLPILAVGIFILTL